MVTQLYTLHNLRIVSIVSYLLHNTSHMYFAVSSYHSPLVY